MSIRRRGDQVIHRESAPGQGTEREVEGGGPWLGGRANVESTNPTANIGSEDVFFMSNHPFP
jgi:hypothetical protein